MVCLLPPSLFPMQFLCQVIPNAPLRESGIQDPDNPSVPAIAPYDMWQGDTVIPFLLPRSEEDSDSRNEPPGHSPKLTGERNELLQKGQRKGKVWP